MERKFNQIPPEKPFELKKLTFAHSEKNSAISAAKKEHIFATDKFPVKGDVFTRFTSLQSSENSSIFKPMAEGSTELGTIQPEDLKETKNKPQEAQQPSDSIRTHHTLQEESELAKHDKMSADEWKELEDVENIDALLAELKGEQLDEKEQIMTREQVGERLGMNLYGNLEGNTRHVYFVKDNPDIAVKADKSFVDPIEKQKEKRINNIFHVLFKHNIPKITDIKHFDDEHGKVSLEMQERVHPIDENVNVEVDHPMSEVERIRKDELKMPRIFDANRGNVKPAREKNGKVSDKYLDDILIDEHTTVAYEDAIRTFMEKPSSTGEYSDEDRKAVQEDFDWLKEEIAKNQPKAADKSIPRRELQAA